MPDPASIRSEEFINAFDYRDPEPRQGQPLAFAFERVRVSVCAQPRPAAVFRQDRGGGTAGGPRVEPRFAARQFRLDGARRPRGHHPRGVARAGGAVAAAGHGERGHVRAHGAALGGRRARRPGAAQRWTRSAASRRKAARISRKRCGSPTKRRCAITWPTA